MSGVTRKLLGGVLAISLFICSSLSAFAATYALDSNLPFMQHFSLLEIDGTVIDILDYYDSSSAYPSDLEFGGFTSYSYRPSSPFSLGVASSGGRGINFMTRQQSGDFDFEDDTYNVDVFAPTPGYYVATFSFLADYDFTSFSNLGFRLRIYDYTYGSTDSSRFRYDLYPEFSVSSSVSTSGLFYNTIVAYIDLPQLYQDTIPINRINYNFLVYNVPVDVSYSNFNFSFSSFSLGSDFNPQSDRSFFGGILVSGFDRVVSTIRGFFSRDESNYESVTDPSTSQEIQDTQDMIDNVENFEASLNQNITTEFNKIDFTTPTNLAAPVAYVGDKVTRSVNALGSGYQPLVFVPLTLGIMLIMLGRGVTALGSMVGRSSAAKRSDGGDE